MKSYKIISFLAAMALTGFMTGTVNAQHQVSPNVPLGSYVYDYVDKLDAVGYLPEARPTTKSYSRLQVAKWLLQMERVAQEKSSNPDYVLSMLGELHKEFATELAALETGHNAYDVKVTEGHLELAATDGRSINQNRGPKATASTYQPWSTNRAGYHYDNGLNGSASLAIEGTLGNHMAIAVTPRFDLGGDTHEASLAQAYAKTYVGSMEVQIGKDDMWWGPSTRGALGITNNAKAQVGIKLSSLENINIGGKLHWLGAIKPTVFYSKLSDGRNDVKGPELVGARMEIMPTKRLNLGVSLLAITGGEGRHMSWHDWGRFFTGKNAETRAADKWNSLAGYDISWKLPSLQVYGSIYGEDQSTGAMGIPSLSELAWNAGIYVPKLDTTGNWDARFEIGRTNPAWYNHWVYSEGYTHKGDIIGDAMGTDSKRFYARIGHYDKQANSIGFNVEYIDMNRLQSHNPSTLAFWLDSSHKIKDDIRLNGRLGWARLKDNGSSNHDYLVSVSMTKSFR